MIHLKGADDILQWDPFLSVLVKANSYSFDTQDTVTSVGQNHWVLMLSDLQSLSTTILSATWYRIELTSENLMLRRSGNRITTLGNSEQPSVLVQRISNLQL